MRKRCGRKSSAAPAEQAKATERGDQQGRWLGNGNDGAIESEGRVAESGPKAVGTIGVRAFCEEAEFHGAGSREIREVPSLGWCQGVSGESRVADIVGLSEYPCAEARAVVDTVTPAESVDGAGGHRGAEREIGESHGVTGFDRYLEAGILEVIEVRGPSIEAEGTRAALDSTFAGKVAGGDVIGIVKGGNGAGAAEGDAILPELGDKRRIGAGGDGDKGENRGSGDTEGHGMIRFMEGSTAGGLSWDGVEILRDMFNFLLVARLTYG